MAFRHHDGEAPAAWMLTPDLSSVQPPLDHSGFVYYSDEARDNPLLEYLNRNVFDGQYPVSSYDMMANKVIILPDESLLDNHPASRQPEANEVVTLIVNPGAEEISVANESSFLSLITIGDQVKEVIRHILALSESKDVSYGLDDILGYGYYKNLTDLSQNGFLRMENLNELAGYMKLIAASNSFTSCAAYLLETVQAKGLLFNSLEDIVQNVFNEIDLDSLFNSIKGVVLNKSEPTARQFLEKGQATLAEMESLFGKVVSYLPAMDFLFEFFWKQFNKNLEMHQQTYEFLKRFSKAKSEFDQAMSVSAGETIYKEVMGPTGDKILGDAARHAELLVGGGLFGTIPFLVGTIYQIIYDIINLVINLCWYAFWAASGIVQWMFAKKETPEKEMIAADESLLSLFTMDFDLEKIPGMLVDFSKEMSKMLSAAIESFIAHAAEYGEKVGKMLGSGIVSIGSGVLSLITSGYPKKPTLWNRFVYIVRQWFNIGCILGPLMVDIILMFCSGGISGIFSGAAKLGKLDKVGDAFRFFYKTKELIESLTFFEKMKGLVHPRLIQIGEKIVRQLWSITRSLQSQMKALLHAANEALGLTSKPLAKTEIDAIARKIDLFYDIASVVDLFAALLYFLIGGKEANVNPKGKVVSA